MKKTLLIAAAALAAGVISIQAQVYSQNVVGYVNTVVPAGGYNLVANQLVNGSDVNQTNNSINTAFNGLKSDPNGVQNTVLYLWNGGGYNVYQYYTGADADNNFLLSGSVNGFYDLSGNLQTSSFNQGAGSFLYNPSPTAVTNTSVGNVLQGTNNYNVVAGYNLFAIPEPVSTNLESTLVNFPGTSDPNGVTNDALYKWNGGGYNVYQYFTGADADNNFLLSGSVNGFYDLSGNLQNSAPLVGQGFFIYHYGVTKVWTNIFKVQ